MQVRLSRVVVEELPGGDKMARDAPREAQRQTAQPGAGGAIEPGRVDVGGQIGFGRPRRASRRRVGRLGPRRALGPATAGATIAIAPC
jgi:hypothetical protein